MLKQIKRRKNRTNLIISISAGILMILSVIGFALNLTQQKEKNEKEFKVNIYGKEIVVKLIYFENETNDVLLNYNPNINDFINKKIYFYSHPKIRENSQRLLYYISIFSLIKETCVIGYECFNNELPIKDCNNEIIIFEYSNETKIDKNDKCIIIKGNETNIDKTIDAFLYKIFKK
ncbi:MAG: hypothetical protein QXM27_00860 [Candidatus Pacearchaeota archaeon]